METYLNGLTADFSIRRTQFLVLFIYKYEVTWLPIAFFGCNKKVLNWTFNDFSNSGGFIPLEMKSSSRAGNFKAGKASLIRENQKLNWSQIANAFLMLVFPSLRCYTETCLYWFSSPVLMLFPLGYRNFRIYWTWHFLRYVS